MDFQVHDDPLLLCIRDVRISILLTEKVTEYKSVQDTNYFLQIVLHPFISYSSGWQRTNSIFFFFLNSWTAVSKKRTEFVIRRCCKFSPELLDLSAAL